MPGFVEITTSDGRVSMIELERAETKIGRANSCDVPLVSERDLEGEHVLLAPRKEGVWVACAENARVPVTINGAPHQSGMVPWGTIAKIGTIQLRFVLQTGEKKTNDKAQVSPVVVLGGLALVASIYFLLDTPNPASEIETTVPTAPTLFAATPPGCELQARDPAQVIRQATELGAQAFAKSERYPFDAGDGVQSVMLFRRAAACLTVATQTEAATRMSAEADYMQARISDDYLGHRFRLERALDQARHNDALHETRALIALTENTASEDGFRAWLVRNERQLAQVTAVAAQ